MTASSEWRVGGYFLKGPVATGALRDERLPRRVWSISSCVSTSYPDEGYLTWVQSSPERQVELCQSLDLSTDELAELKGEVSALFDQGLVRWPNVFGTLCAARDFHARWLTDVPDVQLLEIALKTPDVPVFLSDVASLSNNEGDGVLSVLGEERPVGDGQVWGFEVLGFVFGAFHTYLCHGLETEFMDTLGVRFNEHGLITDWADASKASDWINRDEVGAEPVPWYPWRISRYALR